MKAKIAKFFYWEMSHRLPFHKGACKNIHGHSYKLRVEVQGKTDENGMVMDYYDLKRTFAPLIEKLDHSFIVDKSDELMLDFLKANGFKYNVIDKNTTAENIAQYILEEGSPILKRENPSVAKIAIRLFETEDVFAEVEESFR